MATLLADAGGSPVSLAWAYRLNLQRILIEVLPCHSIGSKATHL